MKASFYVYRSMMYVQYSAVVMCTVSTVPSWYVAAVEKATYSEISKTLIVTYNQASQVSQFLCAHYLI